MSSRRFAESLYIQCFSANLAVTRSIVLLTPNALPQRMQQNGCSALRIRADDAVARKSSWGSRVMTFSGQVDLDSPHWMQASSVNHSIASSPMSINVPVGQA